MTHSSAERPEINRVASALTEVQIKREIIANDETENNKEASDSTAMDSACSSSPSGHQSLPSVRRSKRVSTMVSEEMGEYFEGCLVTILREGFPVRVGMIRKPDEDPLNHTHVGSGHDEYICEENGVLYIYVQIFEEPTTLKRFTTGNLELFNAALERGIWSDPNPNVILNLKIGVKMAIAASKYSVDERLSKFTLRVGSSIGNIFTEIENENSQPTSNATIPEPPILPNESTAQDRDESTTLQNGRSCPDSVEIIRKRITEYQQKLREECYRERDEEIKRLLADNEKLAERSNTLNEIVKKQANVIAELQKKRDNENQEKLKHKEELEKVKAVFEEMFGG